MMSKVVKIKVTIPETIAYYDVIVDIDTPLGEAASVEQTLFRNGALSWEDIIGSAPRDTVTFEGVENE